MFKHSLLSGLIGLTVFAAGCDGSRNLSNSSSTQLTDSESLAMSQQSLMVEMIANGDIADEETDDMGFNQRATTTEPAVVRADPLDDLTSNIDAHTDNADKGAVSGLFDWPLYAIHAAVLPDGQVMSYGAVEGSPANGLHYDIWDPQRGGGLSSHITLPVQTDSNMFCSAQSLLADGRLLITGGDQNPVGTKNDGIASANLYNYKSNIVSATSSMAKARWYPSIVPLGNGEMLVHGGRISGAAIKGTADNLINTVPEIYNPKTGVFRQLTGADRADVYTRDKGGWYYPRSWLGNDGKVFFLANNSANFYSLNPKGTGRISKLGTSQLGPFRQIYPAVRYSRNKILTIRPGGVVSSLNIAKLKKGQLTETRLASLPAEVKWSDATVMADGKVFVSGGSEKSNKLVGDVYLTRIYDPKIDSWSYAVKQNTPRLYHSTSLLLQDGSILIAGGGPPGPVHNLNAEIFYPPYLFDASGNWATRPTAILNRARYRYSVKNATITTNAQSVSAVHMVRLGSVTHSFDQSQSFHRLTFSANGTKVKVALPTNRQVTAPGNYMIFLIDGNGVPSEGMIFRRG